MSKKKKIPERWDLYKPIGDRIEGTRFISFKVPLQRNCSVESDSKDQFTPLDLLRGVPNIGLIIDLTNTCRYYDPKEFTENGVQYHKIATVGQEVPNKKVVGTFINAVKKFLDNNRDNDLLIGVHCTHGLNRSGYLVCRYMIDILDMHPDKAINLFNVARGHRQERENYLENLRRTKQLYSSSLPSSSSNSVQSDASKSGCLKQGHYSDYELKTRSFENSRSMENRYYNRYYNRFNNSKRPNYRYYNYSRNDRNYIYKYQKYYYYNSYNNYDNSKRPNYRYYNYSRNDRNYIYNKYQKYYYYNSYNNYDNTNYNYNNTDYKYMPNYRYILKNYWYYY